MFKRIMSVMLAVVMLMSVAIVAVSAAEESDKLYIRVDGDVYYEVQQGETYTYVYSLACDKKVCSLDCTTFYDAEGLKFVPDVDEYGDNTGVEFPNITAVYNFGKEGSVLYNYSSPSGVRFPVADTATEKNVVFQGKFEVTAETGIYDIYTDLKVLGDNNNNKIIFDSVKVDEAAVVNTISEIAGLEPVEAPSDATEATEATEATQATEATEPTQATEATEATQATEATEATEVTEAPTEDESAPAPATKDQSSSNDQKTNTNKNAVKTGSTTAAIAFITVLVMAAGVVMFTSKKKFD